MRLLPCLLNRFRPLTPVTAALLPLLLSGCWFDMNGNQSTFDTKGPVAASQLQVFYVTLWVTLILFIIVGGVLAYATLRFRARSDADAHAEPPPQGHGNPLVEIGLITASVLCLVIIAVPTLKAIWYTYDVPAAEKANAFQVTATANQWWFKFEYPAIDAQIRNPDGSLGKTPLVTGNELIIPVGRAIHIDLRTVDVIHSFWVPKLAGKVDMIPNRGNHLWFKADAPGYFFGQCAEFCGEDHAVMRFRVIALAPDDFNRWVANQVKLARVAGTPAVAAEAEIPHAQFASMKMTGTSGASYGEFDGDLFGHWQEKQLVETPEDTALIAQGRALFQAKTCISCHTIRGHEGIGVTGPDLTHVGARTTIAAGLIDNTADNLRIWISHPASVKPGNKMAKGFIDNKITLNDAEVSALAAYLRSLK